MVASTAVAHRIPAGWYRDKDDPSRRRWWDGIEWTDHYAPVTDTLSIDSPRTGASNTGESNTDWSGFTESTDPRMSALLESIGSRAEQAIAPQPEQLEQSQQSEHDGTDSIQSNQAEYATHSSEAPNTAVTTAVSARRNVPLAVIVLLAGLAGANTVLLGILVSGR